MKESRVNGSFKAFEMYIFGSIFDVQSFCGGMKYLCFSQPVLNVVFT